MIYTRRVYEKGESKGKAYLVDRIWPRGVKKDDLDFEAWLKEIAPSDDLRLWFNHEPDQWLGFKEKYHEELEAMPDEWAPVLEAAGQGDVTLLYGTRDTEHNNAVALKEYLEKKLRKSGTPAKTS